MLTKAAPPDWAAWLAAATGKPVEHVREKLGMTGECCKIPGVGEMNKRPPRLEPGTASPRNLITAGRG